MKHCAKSVGVGIAAAAVAIAIFEGVNIIWSQFGSPLW